MKKGILLYDKGDSKRNSWFIKKLITEGAKEGLLIDLVLSEDVTGDMTGKAISLKGHAGENYEYKSIAAFDVEKIKTYDFAIMRNRNAKMAAFLESLELRCYNSPDVIRLGSDKWAMYEAFKAANIPVMHTQRRKMPYPFILKPRHGHGGHNVYLINNSDDFERARGDIGTEIPQGFDSLDDYINEEYIYQLKASETGRDIRVYVLGENIMTAVERTSETDFRANFSLGGKACEYALLSDEMELAAKAADLIKPDFVGIDIIYNNGKPVINEIEDAAGTRMLYANTDIDAAYEYIKYIRDSL